MAAPALTSLLPSTRLPLFQSESICFSASSSISVSGLFPRNHWKKRSLVLASSASFGGDRTSKKREHLDSSLKKSAILNNIVQDIQPLDVSLIQKDVPTTTLDAMKRTISGMLGLLPSAHFQVSIEALWGPLSKLLVSSMSTGYTLRNAEFRLWVERNFDMCDKHVEKQMVEDSRHDVVVPDGDEISAIIGNNEWSSELRKIRTKDCFVGTHTVEGLGEVTPEAQRLILLLQSRLSSIKRELFEVKRKNGALHMQQFVGEEKNELLDYLRLLSPEKVGELSGATCPEMKEAMASIVHGLLPTLSPKMRPKACDCSTSNADSNYASLPFQPLLILSRDYLARLLFWCMLLGHHLRGAQYRMELGEIFGKDVHG